MGDGSGAELDELEKWGERLTAHRKRARRPWRGNVPLPANIRRVMVPIILFLLGVGR